MGGELTLSGWRPKDNASIVTPSLLQGNLMSTTKVRSPAGTVLARRQAKTYIDPRIGADRGSQWRVRPAAPRTQSPGHETVAVRPAYDVEQPISLTRHTKVPAAGTACPMEPPSAALCGPEDSDLNT